MSDEQIELGEVVKIIERCIKLMRKEGLNETQDGALKLLEHCIADTLSAFIAMGNTLSNTAPNGIIDSDKFTILKKGGINDSKLN